MRVKVEAAHFYTYSDLSVVCGEAVFDRKDPHSFVNPQIIFEVLSPSTEHYDRGEKFGYFLASLQAYVLVSQEKPLVEVHLRVKEKTGPHEEPRELTHRSICPRLARRVNYGVHASFV